MYPAHPSFSTDFFFFLNPMGKSPNGSNAQLCKLGESIRITMNYEH